MGATVLRNPKALSRTPLHGLNVDLGARMVPFAGYEISSAIRASDMLGSLATLHLHL